MFHDVNEQKSLISKITYLFNNKNYFGYSNKLL